MSHRKPVKEAAAPRTEEKGLGKKVLLSLKTKPDDLPEIGHNCWLEWDDILMALKEYFRLHFQDLESICPNTMLLLKPLGYLEHILPILRTEALAGITEENDPLGIRNQTVLLLFRAKISSHMQKVER